MGGPATFYGQVKSYDYMPLLLLLAYPCSVFGIGGEGVRFARSLPARWYISLLSLVSAKVVASDSTPMPTLRCLSLPLSSHWEWKLLPAEFSLSLGPPPTRVSILLLQSRDQRAVRCVRAFAEEFRELICYSGWPVC